NIGKPRGIDIKEKKMTLPLIYALENAQRTTRRRMIYIIKNQNTRRDKVEEVIGMVRESGAIEYARKKMIQYQQEAVAMLDRFPPSPARQALESLVDYVITRKK